MVCRVLHGGRVVEVLERLQGCINDVSARYGGRFGTVQQLARDGSRERARVVNRRGPVPNGAQNTHEKEITAEWPHGPGVAANN